LTLLKNAWCVILSLIRQFTIYFSLSVNSKTPESLSLSWPKNKAISPFLSPQVNGCGWCSVNINENKHVVMFEIDGLLSEEKCLEKSCS